MTFGDFIGVAAQYGLPALAVIVSGWFGLKGIRATARSQSEGEVAAEKIKAQTATEQTLKDLLEEQRTQFIVPLQEAVAKQGGEIEMLKKSLDEERDQKWDALSYIRSLLGWVRANFTDFAVAPMTPLPVAPVSIRHHVDRWHTGSPPTTTSPPTPAPPPNPQEDPS